MNALKILLLNVLFFSIVPNLVQSQIVNYTNKDGLVFNTVDHISEDDEGLIYFSTGEGFNIFNGSDFKLFNFHNTITFSNEVSQTLFLKKGLVLIGTRDKGLFLWDKLKRKIIPLRIDQEIIGDIPSITTLLLDDDNVVWVGCDDGMLFSFSASEIDSKLSDYFVEEVLLFTKLSGTIRTIEEVDNTLFIGSDDSKVTRVQKTANNFIIDSPIEVEGANKIISLAFHDAILFIGTDKGLFRLSDFKQLKSNATLTLSTPWKLEDDIIYSLSVHRNTIWVGTNKNGLYNLSMNGDQLEHFLYSQNSYSNLNSNAVRASFIDSNDNLWVGTWLGGVNMINLSDKNYSTIYDRENEKSHFSNTIWTMAQIPDGRVFLGTHGNGLSAYISGKNFESIKSNEEMKSISSLYYDPISKLLFIGTWGHGIKLYDPYSHKLLPASSSLELLQDDRINSIIRGPDDNIWIGSSENGLFRYSMKNQKLEKIDLPNTQTDIKTLVSDSKRTQIWAGSIKNGVYVIKLNSDGVIENIEQFKTFNSSKDNDNIYAEHLYVHDNGDLWILCQNGVGVLKPNQQPKRLPVINGCVITGIDSDENGNLWLGTFKGLFKLDPETLAATYTLSEYVFYDLFFDPVNKTVLAGTDNGLLIIETEKPIELPPFPALLLSELYTLNQNITPQKEFRGEVILPQNLNYCDTIFLPHYCESFSIDFNALSFSRNNKIKLAHKLNNLDQNWREIVDISGMANYTNIPPGTYEFEVQVGYEHLGSNPETRKLTIIKSAAWWETPIAYLMYTLVFVFIIYTILREMRARLNIRQELKIEKIKQEREHELYQQKLSFFTNISHDIRTPLTLIIGPLEEILNDNVVEKEIRKKMKRMHKNAKMLLNLVNQILNFRKAETNNMQLDIKRVNLNTFVQNICSQFLELAQAKELDFEVLCPDESLILAADPNKLESILINLLSNAIKFTPQYGQIIVQVYSDKKTISISVKDTGVGIPENELDLIFTRFYRSDKNEVFQGTGIGVALIKKYIEMHNGKIEVQSVENKGSRFVVSFPIIQDLSAYPQFEQLVTEKTLNPLPVKEIPSGQSKKPSVLVIDDSGDIREYLEEILEGNFRVYTAENGKEGISIANKKLPNLVICDVMMHGIDGMEVCKEIKSNLNTSHIPIILLTAKTSMESKIEGFEMGSDAYIEKPFNSKFLLTRVKKLIEHREVLKKKLLRSETLSNDKTASTVDEKFIEKIIGHIESRISESEFSVQGLIENMNMSQDQLYRKIKALTGLSINHFIRLVRLKKAARLLSEGKYTVSEVVYEVGFNNPSYFTRCFKAEFGVLPSEYIEATVR